MVFSITAMFVSGVTTAALLVLQNRWQTTSDAQTAQLDNRRALFVFACEDRNVRWHEALESYRHLPRPPGQKRPPNYERVLQTFTDSTVGKIRPCRADARRRVRAG